MNSRPYRYVQVVTTILNNGNIVQLIGTTNSEDKRNGLDNLILRHVSQIEGCGRIVRSHVSYMDASGNMSIEEIALGLTN